MIGSRIVWKMAISNLLKQWKQTVLAILAGSIGAMLIAISVVNYDSVEQSGEQWIHTRLGSINWQLTPKDMQAEGFTQAQVDKLYETTEQSGKRYRILPSVMTEAAVLSQRSLVSEGGEAQKLEEEQREQALSSLLLIGFSPDAAAELEQERKELWTAGLGADELIINKNLAKLLDVSVGDAVTVLTNRGEKLLRISSVVDEYGLTGFRDSGVYNGTLIAAEETVRQLSGIEAGIYPSILVGHVDHNIDSYAMFLDSEVEFNVEFLKSEYENQLEQMNFTIIIGLISAVAIITSMLFMRQLLIMIGESRHQMYGILRALGMTERHIFSMLAAEVLILSLLTALVGTVLGIAGGYVLIGFFFSSFADELARMSGAHIPITAQISLGSAVIVFIAILVFMSIISLLAARKAGKMKITEAIKGTGSSLLAGHKVKISFGFKLVLSLGLACTLAHFYMLLAPSGLDFNKLDGGSIALVFLLWFVACFTVLYVALYLVGLAAKPISSIMQAIGIPRLSVMLAVKYPRQHSGRTYTSGLLFALVMMILVLIISLLNVLLNVNNVDRNSQTVFGFAGYAAYSNAEERNTILSKVENDDLLKEHLTLTHYVEPYMLSISESGMIQTSPVSVTEAILSGVPLTERASQFENDEAALRAVMNDAKYIIIPNEFIDESSSNYLEGGKSINAGDEITLEIYENGLRLEREIRKPVTKKTFIVAGFSQKVENQLAIEHYSSVFVHPSIAEVLKPYGYKWSNQVNQGFVLFQFDYSDIGMVQRIEERFIINGILSFEVPYLKNLSSTLVTKQAGNGFIGFTVLSALIGLMGLAIIQYRAVKDRGNQIAMLRCIGVSGKQILWMYVLEGFIISVIGLLCGWGMGATGAHIILHALDQEVAKMQIGHPFHLIAPIVVGLIIASLLLNLAPAKAALKLKAAVALRMNAD